MRILRVLSLLALAGCMEATGPQANGGPQLLSLTPEPLAGDVGFPLAQPVRVQVLDNMGQGVVGEVVSFTVTEGGGSVTPAQATTNAQGIAETQWQLGAQPGANTLRASSGGLSVLLHATGNDGIGAVIQKVSGGTTDSLPAGCVLGAPLVVKVLDNANQPVAGASVSFENAVGDGTFDPQVATTGADGMASTRWKLGYTGGTNRVRAVLRTAAKPAVEFTARSAPAAPNGFSVMGNKIYDPATCKPILFHGIARPSMESWYGGDQELVDNAAGDFALMKSWGANLVRIPISQTYWVAGTYWNNTAKAAGVDYKAKVIDVVNKARAAGLFVIVDLHASDRGNMNYTDTPDGQQLPDANISVPFWRDVATTFKDDGGVIYELYNEPHDITPAQWLNGGSIPSGSSYPGDPFPEKRNAYTAVGMQTLYDVVRGTGARNMVIVSGLHWGYSLNMTPDNEPVGRVQGYNIAYASHPYDWADKQKVPTQSNFLDWETAWGKRADTDPLIVTEFGAYSCTPEPPEHPQGLNYYTQVMDYADQKGMSWVAWAWWLRTDNPPDNACKYPALLTNWNGTPTLSGQMIKARLATYR
jgi:aryl-phospho-beta-D-glucosidase BglC (GH1 family)